MRAKIGLVLLGMLFFSFSFALLADDNVWTGATVIQPNQVLDGSVNGWSDSIDWWKVVIPGPGGAVFFLESDDTETYLIDFKLYDADFQILGSDTRLAEMKPHFGTVAGGTYYMKVRADYTTNKTVFYKIGVAYTADSASLSGEGDYDSYNATIVGNAITWLFVVDRSEPDEAFDPDIYVFLGDEVIAKSTYREDFDYIRWELIQKREYVVAVVSYAGSGNYWIMMVTYKKSSSL